VCDLQTPSQSINQSSWRHIVLYCLDKHLVVNCIAIQGVCIVLIVLYCLYCQDPAYKAYRRGFHVYHVDGAHLKKV